jgi:Ca-activated chloride channel family protein
MHVTAHLDVDVVAVETEDEVSVLVELTAPPAPVPSNDQPRPARTLQVVLDRSGSMSAINQGAKTALLAGGSPDPKDKFGLTAFTMSATMYRPDHSATS